MCVARLLKWKESKPGMKSFQGEIDKPEIFTRVFRYKIGMSYASSTKKSARKETLKGDVSVLGYLSGKSKPSMKALVNQAQRILKTLKARR